MSVMRRMAHSRLKPTVCRVLKFGFLFFAASILNGAAKPDTAAPVLISTDGGGPKWKTTEQLKSFAAQGDPKACLELGDLLLEGTETPRDVHRAAGLFEQAAKGGEINGWFRLGKISHDGLDGPVDYARALGYFTLAARAGIGEAQHNLGAMLVSGRGVKRNYVEGLAWLIIAAKSGVGVDTEAQLRTRLAKRPQEIAAAEARAAELAKDLARPAGSIDRVEMPGQVTMPGAEQARTSPMVSRTMEKPVIASPVAPKLVLPVTPELELPRAPSKKP